MNFTVLSWVRPLNGRCRKADTSTMSATCRTFRRKSRSLRLVHVMLRVHLAGDILQCCHH